MRQVHSRFKPRQIMLLLHLREQRSISRAAESAGMTQPAASKMLADLEQTFGVKLFERHARGVEPTWYGEVLARHARAAMIEMDRAHDEIAARKSGLSGRAFIGTAANPGAQLIPLSIVKVKRSHPRMVINVDLNFSRPLVTRLMDGQLDFVVGRMPDLEDAADLDFEPITDEPYVLVAATHHSLRSNQAIDFSDLQDLGWIIQDEDGVLRGRLNAALHSKGLSQPKNIVETSSLSISLALLQASDMVALLPKLAVLPFCKAGLAKILPFDLGITMDAFGIITRHEHPLSSAAQVLLEEVRRTAARLYPTHGAALEPVLAMWSLPPYEPVEQAPFEPNTRATVT
jgi:DNA-binding transcriptional LysR family regulator